jgi:site-specific recombinase XerD
MLYSPILLLFWYKNNIWVYYDGKLHGISLRTKNYRVAQQKAKELEKKYPKSTRGKKSYVGHTLRHTFASHLVMEGIPIYTVSKLLGHTDVKTTERYAHLSPEQIQVKIEYF